MTRLTDLPVDPVPTPAGFACTRRRLLCAGSLALAAPAAFGVPANTLTVLYQRDSTSGPSRLDPAVQAAAQALDDELLKLGFQVIQPDPKLAEALDAGPAIAIRFAPDAGFSMLFSLRRNVRQEPGLEEIAADVVLRCRVFVGHSVLAAEDARGTMRAFAGGGNAAFAEQEGLRRAAQKAAALLAGQIAKRLAALSPQEIERRASIVLPPPTRIDRIAVPAEPAAQTASQAAPAQPTGPLPAPARRFALVVGVSDYSGVAQRAGVRIGNLPGVAADRRNVVTALRGRGFDEANIRVLADAEATSASVRDALARLVAATGPEDLVLIFISAHGLPGSQVPSGFGMPVLSDFGPPPRAGLLDFWELQSLVGNLPALRTLLVIDTCHAGGATGMLVGAEVSAQGAALQAGSTSPDPARLARAHALSPRAFAVMAAARPNELSVETASGGGLFTHHWLAALRETTQPTPLEQMFRERIEPAVFRESQPICRKLGDCKSQTPLLAFSGSGNRLWF